MKFIILTRSRGASWSRLSGEYDTRLALSVAKSLQRTGLEVKILDSETQEQIYPRVVTGAEKSERRQA